MPANRQDLLIDAALAAFAFGSSLLLIAVSDAGTSDLDAPAILLAGLASLPLVARRRAPLTVFVFMTCASAALYAIAAPAGPPVGPTIALYSVAAGIGESRASQRVTLAVVVVMLIVHVTAVGIQDGSFPAASLAFAIAVWGGI